ncbi:RsmB/NOP family class I SAM-dependent RNA methyltransferase [Roseovarius aquimarinus]|uniref:RsmB/NOP family class I SAM-dependent RNA methyltransferase n=1 Tax=Roseovarius aquimarinus TaxID=1229156 RepID=A0ABW7I4W7_9RHOB
MTPAARIAAAAELLDRIGAGAPAEKVLTGWARGARFAGSGDRAAVRDLVYEALRCWRSHACLGGGETGRARMIGALRAQGINPETLFTGVRHAPAPLSDEEKAAGARPEGMDALDLPDWLWPEFEVSLGGDAAGAAEALRHRAPIMLRACLRRASRDEAIAALAQDDIHSEAHPIAKTAIIVTEGARRVAQSAAFREGLVELQDGSGQAAMEGIDLSGARSVLDYCAGGGGKALALAARSDAQVFAHDIDPARMRDLPARAARAGAAVTLLETSDLRANSPFSVVLCDAPCSGSGTWRRTPEAKWTLTPERLAELTRMQSGILDDASELVAPGGLLVYATCSVLAAENEARIDDFLARHPEWRCAFQRRYPISEAGDGFYVAHLARSS